MQKAKLAGCSGCRGLKGPGLELKKAKDPKADYKYDQHRAKRQYAAVNFIFELYFMKEPCIWLPLGC